VKKVKLKNLLLVAVCTLVMPLLAQAAHADSYIDFSCGGSSCTGTVTQVGNVYSTLGIGGLAQGVEGGPDYQTGLFNLVFDTSTTNIGLLGDAFPEKGPKRCRSRN